MTASEAGTASVAEEVAGQEFHAEEEEEGGGCSAMVEVRGRS